MYQTIANLRNIEMDGLAADWQTLAHVFAWRVNKPNQPRYAATEKKNDCLCNQ